MIKRKIRKRQLKKAKLIVYRKNSFDIYNKLESTIDEKFTSIGFSFFVPVNIVSFNSAIMDIENLVPVVGGKY